MTPPLPVLIIGSGLGGLNLAHALSKQKIPYRIFERDSEHDKRAQGYRISLDGGGSGGGDGLRAALSPELFDKFEKTCGSQDGVQHAPGGRIDGPSGKVLGRGVLGLIGAGGWGLVWGLGSRYFARRWQKWTWSSWRAWFGSWFSKPPLKRIPTIPSGPDKSYPTDRRMLRSILLTFQEPYITYSSSFSSYTLSPSSVTAHFTNGTSVTGSLLVGADGNRSKVAAQLIGPEAAPLILGHRVIYGKTPLTPEVEGSLHPVLQKGTSFVTDKTADGKKITLVIEVMRFNYPDAPENYIFWALTASQEILAGSDLTEITTRITNNWDPSIKLVFTNQDITQTASLPLTTSNPDHPARWEIERRVTLLGDAVHSMPPTGGQGANSALYDAALLGAALGGGGEGDGWSVETIRAYEEAMRENVGDIVGMACVGAYKVLGVEDLVIPGQ